MAHGLISAGPSAGLSGLSFCKESNWYVSFVEDNSGLFYLQQNDPSIAVKYERQMQDIETSVLEGKLESFGGTPPSIGSLCIAQYTEDQQWYRGQVLGFAEDDSDCVEVVFIDYGNGEILPWIGLKKVPKEFSELPAQAMRCRLANMEPVGGIWSKEAVKLLKELILERELVGVPTHLCKTGAVVVKLFADEEKTTMVAEQLVMAGFAYWKKVKSSMSLSSSNSSNSASNGLSIKGSPGQLSQIKIKKGAYFDLCVSHIESIDSFYCQPVEQSKGLNELINEMQSLYNSGKANELKMSSLKADQVCCARFSADAVWYRGMVKQVTTGQHYKVQFVDFGNSETVPASEIRELASEFMQLPICSVQCCLYGTKPGDKKPQFDNEAIIKFEELTFDKQLVALVNRVDDSGRLALVLFDTTDNKDGVNLNKELSKLKSVICDKDAGSSPMKSDSSQRSSVGAVTPHFVSIHFNVGDLDVGYVAFAQSPFDFSCQLAKNAAGLENMMQELNNEYSALKPGENKLQIVKAGVPCCARFSEDGRFYRAELKEVANTNALIHFVDYGNNENCRLDEVKHLRKEYLKLPKQAFKCKLSGIKAPSNGSFPIDVCAQFNDMVMDKEFDVKVVNVDGEGVVEVSLVERNERNVLTFDVAKTLIDSGLASQAKSTTQDDLGPITTTKQFRDIQVQFDDYIDVMPTHVTNPSQFCCQLLENSDDIDSMMADLEKTYKDSQPNRSVQLKNGMPCVALFPDDKNWYRGSITSLYGREADVNYVDFGNSEKLGVDMIRPIHSNFMKLPAQAFVCSLSGVVAKGKKEWSTDSINQFSGLTLEKQLIACVKVKDQSNLHHIELLDTQTNRKQQTNIADVLVEKGFAEKADQLRNSESSTTARITNGKKQAANVQGAKLTELKLKDGVEENVYVGHVDDLDNIYCQLTKIEDSLYQLTEKLNLESAKLPPVTSLTTGKPVCAIFSEDNSWYRGEIIMAVDASSALVRFVDYGNSETVGMTSMREISADLLKEPKYGVVCSLYNGGMKWKENATKELVHMTADKVLKMAVKEVKGGKHVIDLYDENGKSIASKFVDENEELSQGRGMQAATAKEEAAARKQMPVAGSIEVNPGMRLDCFVSFIETLQDFYVQPCKAVNDLNLVTEATTRAASFQNLNQPKKGDICCANYSADGQWYRAEVIQVMGKEIEALFVDYGNSDIVSAQNLKSLPQNLLEIPRLSIPCSLDGVTSQSDDDIDSFANSTVDQTASVEFVKKNPNGRFDVKLKVNGVAITFDKTKKNPGLHVEANAAATAETGSSIAASCYSTAQSPAVIVEFSDKKLNVGTTENVFVSYVVTAQEFYCQLSKESDKLNILMNNLEENYGNQPPGKDSLVSLVPGVPCAAKYSVDGGWYRAALENLQGPTQAKIDFVDYGNVETVDVKDLKILKDEFVDDASFAFKCSLMGDVGSAVDFEGRVMEREFDMKIVGLSGSTYVVDLYYDGKSLSEELSTKVERASKEKLEPRLKGYKMAEIKKGDTVDVYYLDGKSPEDFYCHLVKYEKEFEKMVCDIAEVGEQMKNLGKLETGLACVALFSEDGAWYRGKILDAKEREGRVLFVDYGNEEWMKAVVIKCISEDLLSLPMQAVNCSLTNVFPASQSGWSEDEIKLFQSKCDQKMLSARVTSYEKEKFNIELKDMQKNETINDAFRKSVNEAAETKQKQDGAPRFKDAGICRDMTLESLCTFVKPNGVVSCQLIKYQNELSALMDDIALYCDGAAKEVSNIDQDLACLALYDEDDGWYRAKIIKYDSESATVRFVDYGNESICPAGNLRGARPKDLELPVTCIDCQIPGIDAEDDVSKVIEETCLDQELIVNVKDVLNNDLISADLLMLESKESISSIVNKVIPASKVVTNDEQSSQEGSIKKFEKLTLAVGTSDNVICTSVTSFNIIGCHVLRNSKEFDEMMDKVAVHCGSNHDVLKNPVVGQCCLGIYPVDGGWYRAEVISVSSDQLKLKYVDYGNEDDVSFTDTREMVDEFMKLPALCISCKLHDVHQEDLDVVQAKKWMEESCLNHEYKMTVMADNDDIIEVNLNYVDSEETVNDELYANFELGEAPAAAITTSAVEFQAAPIDEKPDVVTTAKADAAQPSDSLEFANLKLKVGEKIPAICSYIDDILQIYCQPSEFSAELDQLMAHIAEYCAEMNSSTESLNVGDPCFAMFGDDGEWYRAEVVKLDGDVIEVYFVDYGNHDIVKLDKILPIARPFLNLPKACFLCVTEGSVSWLSMADVVKVWIEETLIGEEVEVELIKKHHGDGYLTKIYHEGHDVEKMIQEKFGDSAEKKEDDENGREIASSEISILPGDAEILAGEDLVQFKHETMVNPSNETALCTHVDSLHEVFFQLTKYQQKFDEISERMQAYCNENNRVPKEFKTGFGCLAKYTQDDQWYRSEIIEVLNDSVKVSFIDYGNTDIVLFENTRVVGEEFASLPATSVKCCLHDVHEEDIDVKAALQWLQENLVEQEVKVVVVGVVDGLYDCTITKEGDVETINDQLYYQFELAAEEHENAENVSTAGEDAVEPVERESTENEAEDNQIETEAAQNEMVPTETITNEADTKGDDVFTGKFDQHTPKLGAKERAYCTHVDSLNHISIQLIESQELFDELSDKISEFCQKESKIPEKLDLGSACLAKSSDGEWYRGEIIEISDETIDVYFVDYGNNETVEKQNTRAVKKEFASLPAMSITCQLYDVHEDDIDVEAAVEWLQESLLEFEVDVEIIGKVDDSYDVILTKENEDVSVNDVLYEMFEMQEESPSSEEDEAPVAKIGNDKSVINDSVVNDSMIKDSVKGDSVVNELNPDANDFLPIRSKTHPPQVESRDLESGTTVVMHLSFPLSPSLFWCQFDESADDLINMMEEIGNHYDENEMPALKGIPEIGTICCAQFSEDGKWYRGEVCARYDDAGDGASCMILFIDYGNAERVELNNIRELKSKFFNLKRQAVKCSLHGIKAAGEEWTDEAVYELEEICADKILEVEIVSKQCETWNVVVKVDDNESTVNQIMVEKGFGTSDVTNCNGAD